MEPPEFLVGEQEGLLQDVVCILRAAGQSQDGRVEAVLVSADQDPERLGLARPTRIDEALVVHKPGHQ